MSYHSHEFPSPPRTPDEFLRAYEGVEGKREFVHGRVIDMMVNVTAAHMRVTLALANALMDRLSDGHAVAVADFAIETPAGIRFPDVMVSADRYEGTELKAIEPSFVAEVLSESSTARDFGPKVLEYTSVETLKHYLILDQTGPTAWLWSRDEEGGFGEPALLRSRDDVLILSGLEIELPLSTIYR